MRLLRAIGGFFAVSFQSPAARHAETVAAFRERGFNEIEAELAARDMYRSCLRGLPTPQWILSRLEETSAA